MTLSVLEGHFLIACLLKCNILCICGASRGFSASAELLVKLYRLICRKSPAFGAPVGVTPFQFRRDRRSKKLESQRYRVALFA